MKLGIRKACAGLMFTGAAAFTGCGVVGEIAHQNAHDTINEYNEKAKPHDEKYDKAVETAYQNTNTFTGEEGGPNIAIVAMLIAAGVVMSIEPTYNRPTINDRVS